MIPESLRILFITTEYPDAAGECGGVGNYIAAIAPVLVAHGHEVHILSCVNNQATKDYLDRGVHIHYRRQTQIPGLGIIDRIIKIPTTTESLKNGLSNYLEYCRLGLDFDVIEHPAMDGESWLLAFMNVTPLVAHLHFPIMLWYHEHSSPMNIRDMKWASALENFTIRRAREITCPSDLIVQKLKENGCLKGLSSRVIPPSVYGPAWETTQPVEETQPTVLSIGWLGKNKAPEMLVDAISHVRKTLPDAKARFLGTNLDQRDGVPYLEWIKRWATDLTGCEFVGFIPHSKVKSYISSSRVVAVTSWFESYSMVALEAMACGRPVVVTETTGVAKLVERSRAGRVVPAGNSKALAEALRPFLMDANYADEVGKRGQDAIREWLDPDKISREREFVYQEAMRSFNGRPGQKFSGNPAWNNSAG